MRCAILLYVLILIYVTVRVVPVESCALVRVARHIGKSSHLFTSSSLIASHYTLCTSLHCASLYCTAALVYERAFASVPPIWFLNFPSTTFIACTCTKTVNKYEWGIHVCASQYEQVSEWSRLDIIINVEKLSSSRIHRQRVID